MYKVLKSSKAAIRFSLKHSKKYLLENRCQESLIILWFSFGGPDKRVSYSTGYTVSYADWDYQKQRVKTNKSRVINSHTVNNYLNKLETELMNTYSRSIDEERLITKELVDIIKEGVKLELNRQRSMGNPLNRLSITGEDTEYLTRNEVSKVLNVTVQTLNNWRKEGVLNPIKIGGRVLYRKEDVYNDSRLVA